MAMETLKHVPDLTGIPENIQKEHEWARTAIYNLLNRINSIPATVSSSPTSGGMQGGLTQGGFVDAVTPTAVSNDTVTYKLPSTPDPPESLRLYKNAAGAGGVLLRQWDGTQATNADYTLHGDQIVFVVAPIATDFIVAFYRTK